MQVYSKTDARQNFATLYNSVKFGGSVVGVGRGKIKVEGKIMPEVIMVRMPTPDDIEVLRQDIRGFKKALQEWLMKKIAEELE
ncbi:MAG: hypothetical protein P1V18_06090 [Candidatus Gracilibacteria bacterium]|nr:hypothetical protein [Candidatus Gracilibacteria bacterium]